MNTSQAGQLFIKRYEQFRDKMYLDQGGKPTIGWGHLIEKDDPMKYMTRTISQEEGDRLFESDLYFKSELALNTFVHVNLNQYEYDALASLVFNIGAGRFSTSSILRLVNLEAKEQAANEFKKWNKVRVEGKLIESAGLTKRREEEKKMFLGEEARIV